MCVCVCVCVCVLSLRLSTRYGGIVRYRTVHFIVPMLQLTPMAILSISLTRMLQCLPRRVDSCLAARHRARTIGRVGDVCSGCDDSHMYG